MASVASLDAASVWNGSTDANWGEATNWTPGTEPGQADAVTFSATIPASGSTIALSSGEEAQQVAFYGDYTLSGGDLTVGEDGDAAASISRDIYTDAGVTATITSTLIDNTYHLNKRGDGTLILSGTNSTSKHIDHYAGILSIRAAQAVPGSYIHVNGSGRTAEVYGGVTVASNRTVYLTGTTGFGGLGVLHGAGGDNTWSGTVQLHGSANTKTVSVEAGSSLTLSRGFATSNAAAYGVNKLGDGTLILLDGQETRTWNTQITAGVVNIRHNDAMGSADGTTTVNAGTALEMQNDITIAAAGLSLSGSGPAGAGALRNVSGDNAWNGPVTLAADATVGVDAGSLALDGAIGGTASLAKVGAGTLTLSGASGYSGSTTVAAGTLTLAGGADRLPTGTTLTLGTGTTGGTLDLGGQAQEVAGLLTAGSGTSRVVNSDAAAGTLTVNLAAGSETFSGILGNAGQDNFNFAKDGAGTLELASANSYSGTTTIDGGTLTLGGAGALGGTSGVTVNSGGTLEINGHGITQSITLNDGTVKNSTSSTSLGGTLTLVGSGTIDSTEFIGITAKITGTGDFIKTGARHIAIHNTANDYQGATILETYWTDLYAAEVFPNTTDITLGGSINLRGYSQTIRSLSGTNPAASIYGGGVSTLTIGYDDGSGSYAGLLYQGAGHVFNVTKIGAGTQTFTGDAGHSGTTTIEGGTLALADEGYIDTSPLIDVQSGATFDVSGVTGGSYALVGGQMLIGNGTVVGNLDVASGSTISAGASPGHLLMSGDYTQGGTLLAELGGTAQGSPTGYDWIEVSGSATFDAGATIDVDLVDSFDPQIGSSFDILTAAGGITNADLTGITIDFSDAPSLGQWTTEIVSLGGAAEALRISSVPEPSAAILCLLGTILLFARRRR